MPDMTQADESADIEAGANVLLHVLRDRNLAEVRRPRRARHSAVTERRITLGLDRFARAAEWVEGFADVEMLD